MCVQPRIAWQRITGGPLVFSDRQPFDVARKFVLPCGKCIECRRTQANDWVIRCLLESQQHEKNCVITLTYDDDHCPIQLVKSDYQKFFKRFRKEIGKFRYFMSGEYGEKKGRPHMHIIIFGYCPDDVYYWKTVHGRRYYRSPTIEKLWSLGFSLIDVELTAETVKYSANYMQKFDEVYGDLQKPFCAMSLKPGIGYNAITEKMFVDGKIWFGGRWYRVPRYFYKIALREHRFDSTLKKYRDNKKFIASILSSDNIWDNEKRKKRKAQKFFEKSLY